MPDKLYHNEEWLRAQIQNGVSFAQIARKAGCNVKTVNRWAKKLEYPRPSKQRRNWRQFSIKFRLLTRDDAIPQAYFQKMTARLDHERPGEHPAYILSDLGVPVGVIDMLEMKDGYMIIQGSFSELLWEEGSWALGK